MNAEQGAALIDVLAESVRRDPSQFKIEIRQTGQKIVSYGGVGLSINVSGGGAPGSKTIGNQVTMGGTSAEIAKGVADHAILVKMQELADLLSELSRHVKSPTPDKGAISGIVESLKKSWVPAAITAVVTAITKSVVGV